MPTPGRTQKQIAERYKGNLGYYKKKHPWRVARFCASFLAIVGGIAAIFVYQKLIFRRQASEEFFSSGKISSHHAKLEQDCAQCHDKNPAMGGAITLAKFKSVIKDRFHHGIDFSSIDHKCQECHEMNPPVGSVKKYDLHEPNVVDNRSCSICHQEHLGPGPMKPVADLHCASCHNDPGIMQASAKKGATLPRDVFHLRPHPAQQLVFEVPRPTQGYTQVFHSFADEHPEFQLIRQKARDPDVLRFNHQRHFAADIPPVNGQKLDCNYCHKPEPGGRFYQRVSFAANCQACHALLFDKNNPQLHLPHGDVNLVRTFLRTLPAQYADFARLRPEKMNRSGDVKTFVSQQMNQLRAQFGSDDEFERAVFFEIDPYKPQRQMAAMSRANFAGCAFCHEVKMEKRVPAITPPILVDRWMPQAHFNHAKHTSVKCDECHHASQSRETAEVLMPAKANCVTCHSPKGRVASDCITCHTYHAPGQDLKMEVHADASTSSFKEMLVGR
jgi:hypothetical protein